MTFRGRSSLFRHPGECRDLAGASQGKVEIPAFAGMTAEWNDRLFNGGIKNGARADAG
jgi:hypothetical protein